MKSRTLTCINAMTLFVALAIPVPLTAQGNQNHTHRHHHYKLVDLRTFGGPQSYVNGAQVLNDRGTVAGWADTSTPDPYYPNVCFNPDCFVSHAFQWQRGVLNDLGALPDGQSSFAGWVSANGLIVGNSQNGEIDPLLPGVPEIRAVLWREGQNTVVLDNGEVVGSIQFHESAIKAQRDVGLGHGSYSGEPPQRFVGTTSVQLRRE